MPLPHPSRRDFLGASALALAGLAAGTSRLGAQEAKPVAPKRPPNPYVYGFKVGELEAFSISDGHMLFKEGLGLMHPESDRPRMKATLESARERTDALPLYINILGLRKGDEVALVDAGFGARHPWVQFGWMEEGLATLGIKREQVTAGFLSHGHSDHLDGFVDGDKPTFPNAKVYALREEIDFWRAPEPDFSKTRRDRKPLPNMIKQARKCLDILERHGRLEAVRDGDRRWHDAVEILAAPGHTAGHACYEIRSGGESLVHLSDMVHHHQLMFEDVGWTIALDHDHEVAIASRRKLFNRIAAARARAFAFHIPWPGLGTVIPKGEHFAWVPERWSWGS